MKLPTGLYWLFLLHLVQGVLFSSMMIFAPQTYTEENLKMHGRMGGDPIDELVFDSTHTRFVGCAIAVVSLSSYIALNTASWAVVDAILQLELLWMGGGLLISLVEIRDGAPLWVAPLGGVCLLFFMGFFYFYLGGEPAASPSASEWGAIRASGAGNGGTKAKSNKAKGKKQRKAAKDSGAISDGERAGMSSGEAEREAARRGQGGDSSSSESTPTTPRRPATRSVSRGVEYTTPLAHLDEALSSSDSEGTQVEKTRKLLSLAKKLGSSVTYDTPTRGSSVSRRRSSRRSSVRR